MDQVIKTLINLGFKDISGQEMSDFELEEIKSRFIKIFDPWVSQLDKVPHFKALKNGEIVDCCYLVKFKGTVKIEVYIVPNYLFIVVSNKPNSDWYISFWEELESLRPNNKSEIGSSLKKKLSEMLNDAAETIKDNPDDPKNWEC